jgi:S1-C subfamily serine protease
LIRAAQAAVTLIMAVLVGCGDDGRHASPPAVRVRASGCSLVDELAIGSVVGDGLVLTVAHVLRGASAVTVDGEPGTVVAIDHRIDAALITADVLIAPRAAFDLSPRTGVASLPSGPAMVIDVVDADVDEPRDDTTYRRRALVIDAEIRRGDSGSTVVGPDGAVLGMVFATSTGRDHIAYAVASTELAAFVDGRRDAIEPVDTGEC